MPSGMITAKAVPTRRPAPKTEIRCSFAWEEKQIMVTTKYFRAKETASRIMSESRRVVMIIISTGHTWLASATN